jgi:hypothetical protein
LQQEYIKAGEARYPGAVRNTNFPLAVEGGITESDPVEGVRTYTATISGFMSVPQTP